MLTRQLASPRPVRHRQLVLRNSLVKDAYQKQAQDQQLAWKLPRPRPLALHAASARRQVSASARLALRPKVVESNKRSTISMRQFSHECSKSDARVLQLRWAYKLYGEAHRVDAHPALSRLRFRIELIDGTPLIDAR